MQLPPGDYRASNGTFYRIVGSGEPLLLLHGLLASGAMFDPFITLLQDRFCMLVPDLRGHGRSAELPPPYSVEQMTADLDAVRTEAGFTRGLVLGYSHGGTVAQQLARNHPEAVSRLLLGCTYACNVATAREWVEAWILQLLLLLVSPGTIAGVIAPAREPVNSHGMTKAQAEWLQQIIGQNRADRMRGAARGLLTFDSRSWLRKIRVPTLVVAGTADDAVPRHHFDSLTGGIPGATGREVAGAGHALIWTHTRELADIVCEAAAASAG
jgi:3-oxoadipate enol-lactonase